MIGIDESRQAPGFRTRVLNSEEASKYCGFNVQYWRELARKGVAPKPVRLSERKLGWTMGSLIDWIEERSGKTA
ncbi:helix-turn-helix transcriptional regulator [Methylobacterium iners]|uniref:helix-turn-helix transcriptional regulator n=1 Tax=Methylobacterium iners TaxID=418707 RepID=UPI001EE33B4F|nr:hypothetical protein [Methylobacterium iners]